MGEQKKTGERRSDRYELKRKTGERDREREREPGYISFGSIIKSGDNKYVMGTFSTKCGCLSFLEMGPLGDKPGKSN